MNERIKQLAEQAGANYYSLGNRFEEFDEHKFAQLIVRECARVAKEGCLPESDDYNSGRTWAGIDVLKHFGVKE